MRRISLQAKVDVDVNVLVGADPLYFTAKGSRDARDVVTKHQTSKSAFGPVVPRA
ncbi:MAG: hypothetical protein OXH76_05920 [Boseongicola sp.]|nr:hypothetical protein [Boseongicola sp.]